MGVETDRVSALACVPSAIPAAERATHFVLARKLFTGLARERTELADGYAVRFEPDAWDRSGCGYAVLRARAQCFRRNGT